MKKGFLIALAAVALLAASCVKQAEETVVPVSGFPKITATTNGGPATKVSVGEAVDGVRALTWDKGDALSVFYRSSIPMKYVLEGEGGEASGVFGYAAGAGGGPEFPLVYAAYPYDREVKYEDGALWVTVPPVQAYTAGGFDPKANVMVGAADPGANLYFKNVGGYLVFQFWGEDAEVSKVTVSGAMGEYLAGQVLMGVEDGYTPWIEEWGEGSEEVSLVCNPPVKVGATADAATEFWLVVMPQTLMDGFTVTVEWNGGTFSQTMDASYEVVRSKVNRLDPLELGDSVSDEPIEFKDLDLKAYLIEMGVDTDGDGEISYKEAAAVTSFDDFFRDDEGDLQPYPFTSFDEFQFFTGITEIANSQFGGWNKLESIQFPPSLKAIPDNCFGGCSSLAAIDIPGNVKYVGSSAFGGCSGLKSAILREGVETTGNSPFGGCYSLESIEFPGTLKAIPYCGGLSGLKEVVLHEGNEIIPNSCFGGCYSLEAIDIPSTVKHIGSSAFGGLSGLKTVVLREGLETTGESPFGGCSSLERLEFPGTLKVIPACGGLFGLKEVVLHEGNEVIPAGAFGGCSSLEAIDIPGTVKTVGSYAFGSCSKMKTAILREGVEALGESPFGGCSSLEKIEFPSTVKVIPSCGGLYGLKEVVLHEGNEVIPNGAFGSCSSLEAIDIPGTVKTVGASAFGGCTALKTVIFEEGITAIGNCFGGNTQLEKIVFPSTLEVIPSGLCNAGLSSLKDVVLTPGIKELGSSAFGSCPALTAIDIPGSVEIIGDVVFSNCTSLKTVTMHEGTKQMGNANFQNTALESFTFPGTIEVVNSSNFYECSNFKSVDLKGVKKLTGGSFTSLPSLTTVTMYEGLTSIDAAFSNSGLTSVVIPASVTYLAAGAFAECPLTSITFLGTTPPDGDDDAFYGTDCPIYVPASAVETYKTSTVWSPLADRIVAAP